MDVIGSGLQPGQGKDKVLGEGGKRETPADRRGWVGGGGKKKAEEQHAWGKLLARERIDRLMDPGTFVELNILAQQRKHGNIPVGGG